MRESFYEDSPERSGFAATLASSAPRDLLLEAAGHLRSPESSARCRSAAALASPLCDVVTSRAERHPSYYGAPSGDAPWRPRADDTCAAAPQPGSARRAFTPSRSGGARGCAARGGPEWESPSRRALQMQWKTSAELSNRLATFDAALSASKRTMQQARAYLTRQEQAAGGRTAELAPDVPHDRCGGASIVHDHSPAQSLHGRPGRADSPGATPGSLCSHGRGSLADDFHETERWPPVPEQQPLGSASRSRQWCGAREVELRQREDLVRAAAEGVKRWEAELRRYEEELRCGLHPGRGQHYEACDRQPPPEEDSRLQSTHDSEARSMQYAPACPAFGKAPGARCPVGLHEDVAASREVSELNNPRRPGEGPCGGGGHSGAASHASSAGSVDIESSPLASSLAPPFGAQGGRGHGDIEALWAHVRTVETRLEHRLGSSDSLQTEISSLRAQRDELQKEVESLHAQRRSAPLAGGALALVPTTANTPGRGAQPSPGALEDDPADGEPETHSVPTCSSMFGCQSPEIAGAEYTPRPLRRWVQDGSLQVPVPVPRPPSMNSASPECLALRAERTSQSEPDALEAPRPPPVAWTVDISDLTRSPTPTSRGTRPGVSRGSSMWERSLRTPATSRERRQPSSSSSPARAPAQPARDGPRRGATGLHSARGKAPQSRSPPGTAHPPPKVVANLVVATARTSSISPRREAHTALQRADTALRAANQIRTRSSAGSRCSARPAGSVWR